MQRSNLLGHFSDEFSAQFSALALVRICLLCQLFVYSHQALPFFPPEIRYGYRGNRYRMQIRQIWWPFTPMQSNTMQSGTNETHPFWLRDHFDSVTRK